MRPLTSFDSNDRREEIVIALPWFAISISLLLSLLRPRYNQVALGGGFGSRKGGSLDTVVSRGTDNPCIPNDVVFQQKLKCFWVTGLDEVPVMFEYQFDLSITQRAIPDVLDDRFRNWNL